MIAGVRQFKLINALGAEYDMTRPDALLHAPDGLGWGTERTVNRLGMTYIGINEKEIHQSPSGEMVFRTYEEYGRFLSFCQQGGLVLCYKPLETWYYCECLISIQKSEIQWENNHLICPVQFTLLSYWYEKVVAQTAEPPEPVEPSYRTVTGDPAVFNARYSYPIKDLSVAIQGTQDLNGYDKPWVGGAGKNMLDPEKRVNSLSNIRYYQSEPITLRTGTYTLSCSEVVAGLYVKDGESNANLFVKYNAQALTFTLANSTLVWFDLFFSPNPSSTASIEVQLEQGSTATAYEPYENICPITSYTSVTLTQTGSTTNTYEVELTGRGNVYKGTLDVTSGELVVNWGHIASYNGETLPGEWISDRDEYASGTTPTTGADVYYALATPQTYTLTPTQLSNLIGQNSIQADAGEVTVTYRTDARTEYKVYPYQYSYRYGDTAQNVFDISCDLPSYFKLTIFGEATNPSWRVVQNGSIVKSGKLNATIGSSQKLVINTDPKNTEIALYTLSNTRINNLYGYSDFATERIFALPQGESQLQVLTEDEQSPKVMIEVLKHV